MSNLSPTDVFFQAPNAPKPVFDGLRPGTSWRSLRRSLRSSSGLRRGQPFDAFGLSISAPRAPRSQAPSKKNSWLRLCSNSARKQTAAKYQRLQHRPIIAELLHIRLDS